MALRRNAAIGPDTQVTVPNTDSAALATPNWPSYQESWMRVSRVASALRARAWPLTAPILRSATRALTHWVMACGDTMQSESVKTKISPCACEAALVSARFLPTLRSRQIKVNARRDASLRSSSVLPSVEASSTTMSSRFGYVESSTDETQRPIRSTSSLTASMHVTRGGSGGSVTPRLLSWYQPNERYMTRIVALSTPAPYAVNRVSLTSLMSLIESSTSNGSSASSASSPLVGRPSRVWLALRLRSWCSTGS